MTASTTEKIVTLRDILWIATLLVAGGMAIANFARKDEVAAAFEEARRDRVATIEKVMSEHKADQVRDMDRLWKKLDAIDAKIDKIRR